MVYMIVYDNSSLFGCCRCEKLMRRWLGGVYKCKADTDDFADNSDIATDLSFHNKRTGNSTTTCDAKSADGAYSLANILIEIPFSNNARII
ncbi:uncharacterized protein EAE98_000910 [Botrytis deweyae]|uniref:Uncharacterized protein n=1 Tax=Botrytis deweyae TaxID=2478750 RepID=A0ABQ7J064_9HELO|nr:uncharacterized protein EAE98_000910 [Botrytis deweyae]KAF7938572.1 hypothetical protein EAE98_000910 [Botrytis deweyae]